MSLDPARRAGLLNLGPDLLLTAVTVDLQRIERERVSKSALGVVSAACRRHHVNNASRAVVVDDRSGLRVVLFEALHQSLSNQPSHKVSRGPDRLARALDAGGGVYLRRVIGALHERLPRLVVDHRLGRRSHTRLGGKAPVNGHREAPR